MKGQYTGMGHSTIQPAPKIIYTEEEIALRKVEAHSRRLIRRRKDMEAVELAERLTEHMKLDDDKPLDQT